MRLIDIDAFRKDWGLAERCEDCERDARECQYDQIYTRMDFCGWLDDAEIIDAVQVVRCFECKAFILKAEKPRYTCYNPNGLDDPKPNDYCSHGKRRTDETKRN